MLQNFLEILQNQTNKKHFSNPQDICKSAKNFLEKHNPKEDSSKTTISKLLTLQSLGGLMGAPPPPLPFTQWAHNKHAAKSF